MQTHYYNNNSTIIHGDALKMLDEAAEDGSVDLVFADPPYNTGKRFGTFVLWKQ